MSAEMVAEEVFTECVGPVGDDLNHSLEWAIEFYQVIAYMAANLAEAIQDYLEANDSDA